MLKQKANTKLPTFLQWAKMNEALDDDGTFAIERILFGDEWKTLTFVTSEFRYSIKFPTKEAYTSGVDEVLDAFFPKRFLCVKLEYEGETREMDVIIRNATELDKGYIAEGVQNDWGITFTPKKWVPQEEKPAQQKKRSARQRKPKQPEVVATA